MRSRTLALALCLPLLALPPAAGQTKGGGKVDKTFGRPHIDAVTAPAKVLKDAKVIDFGKTLYRGKIDPNLTLERVRAGKRLEHRNDGAIFRNRERLLPTKRDRDYYREFVHFTKEVKGLRFPGPQRVVVGKKGEVRCTTPGTTTPPSRECAR
jgi:hypothetical protein